MSFSNIVLRAGVGPTATIGLFVTHGLGIGSPPPPVPSSAQTNSAPKPDHPRGVTHYSTTGVNPKKLEELRQQKAIIAKQLEAQELRLEQIKLNKQVEVEKRKDKQTARQLEALDREYKDLMAKISADKLALRLAKMRYDEEEAFILLCAALPFLNLEGKTMN